MTRPRGRAMVSLLVLAAGLLLSACGIPLSDTAQTIPNAREPKTLLDLPSTSTTAPQSSANSVPMTIYLLNSSGTRLVATTARVPPLPQITLDILTYGPTAADSERGLTTALSLAPQPNLKVRVDKPTGVATVALDYSTYYLPPVQEFQALAQIVYTLTVPQLGAHSVEFTYDGTPVEAYLPDGQYVSGPVTRKDYASLAPVTRHPVKARSDRKTLTTTHPEALPTE